MISILIPTYYVSSKKKKFPHTTQELDRHHDSAPFWLLNDDSTGLRSSQHDTDVDGLLNRCHRTEQQQQRRSCGGRVQRLGVRLRHFVAVEHRPRLSTPSTSALRHKAGSSFMPLSVHGEWFDWDLRSQDATKVDWYMVNKYKLLDFFSTS